jgi:hypothetical protein
VGQFEQQDLRVRSAQDPQLVVEFEPAMLVGVLNSTPRVRVRQPNGH